MSSTAIKDVTRALQRLLLSQLTPVGGSTVQVTLLPPGEALPSGLGVNLYLYRIIESPFSKNQPWPGDRANPGTPMPALGLELSYLLTPFAPAPDTTTANGDDAHTMLGAAMLTLHQNPILNDVHVTGFDADAELSSALFNSYEQIKIRLTATSLEELSKIWATINQPYKLSVAYDISLVELTPDIPPPINAGVVLSTSLDIRTMGPPRVANLSPATGAVAHVDGSNTVVGNLLTINGSGFSLPGQTAVVHVGGQLANVSSAPAPTDTALTVTLPVTPDAGPSQDVVVTLNGISGTPLPFAVVPWLDRLTPMRTAIDASGGTPTLSLQGSGFTTTPQAVRFDGPAGTTNVTAFSTKTETSAVINIPTNLANGIYQVRMVLAGPGNLASNARTLEVFPLLNSPIGLAVVTVNGNQVHRLTLNGARLNGTAVRVLIDGVAYQAPTNANAAQLVFTLSRLLSSGQHTVAVVINGSQSHDVALVVA